jgi:hypothetical protein
MARGGESVDHQLGKFTGSRVWCFGGTESVLEAAMARLQKSTGNEGETMNVQKLSLSLLLSRPAHQ